MIVKNEATRLPQCLRSVQAVVDEMIVLDTGSTDETPAIARQFGAKVFESTWQQDFAAARNEALAQVTGDWVLVLDADETLTPECVGAIRQAIAVEDHLVVNLIRQEIGAAQSPYSLVSRLFRRHPDLSFSRPYHAMIDDSVIDLLEREPHWRVVSLPQVAILHDGYQAAAIAARDKSAQAEAAMSRFLETHPTDPNVCSKLGALYVSQDRVEEGIALLEQGLQASNLDASLRYELHYHLGIARDRQQNLQAAATHYAAALKQPILPQLKLGAYLNLGNLQLAAGEAALARETYETAIAVDPTLAKAHYNLGMALKALGQLSGAIAAYQRALQFAPDYAEAHQNLGVVLLKLGRVPESLRSFQSAIALYDQRQSPEGDRLRRSLQEMGFL